jgi:hypothetical protein
MSQVDHFAFKEAAARPVAIRFEGVGARKTRLTLFWFQRNSCQERCFTSKFKNSHKFTGKTISCEKKQVFSSFEVLFCLKARLEEAVQELFSEAAQ